MERGIHECAENGSAANLPRAKREGIPGCFAPAAGAAECSEFDEVPGAGVFAAVGPAGPRRSIATHAAAPASNAIKTAILGGRRTLARYPELWISARTILVRLYYKNTLSIGAG